MQSILSQGIGYLILLGLGLVMALGVTLLIKAETKWLGTKKTFEWFSTAGRNVKTGLIASSVVSAWTWAATLLQSSTVTYQFGISGPFWYAAGASIQLIIFSIVAIELKRKAPSSHTFPEIIYARFGNHAHKIFLFFAIMTNTIVTAMLVLGGAAVLNSLTGVDIYVAAFLIPVGVIIYTFFGGLKATFFADYMNTAIMLSVVIFFVVVIYFLSPDIGGIFGMYEKLSSAAFLKPVEGNASGSYLTMASTGALIFGIINIVGNFGTVFVDQSYWQRAIAARPQSAMRGFLLGGLAWFAIPFTIATTLGLSAIAFGVSLSPSEIDNGLVAPTAASTVLGETGAILLLAIVFIAVTAAGSAQLIAVSSLVTYDIYRTYIRPSSTGRQLMRVSRKAIVGFGIGMGILASILLQVGASLQYVYLTMGIWIGSAVIPILLSVIWKKTNKVGAIAGCLVGLVSGISVWIMSAYILYGEVSISSTGEDIPLLFGNITSISVGAALVIVISVIRPNYFNFEVMKQKILVVDEKIRRIIEQDNDEQFLKKSATFSYRIVFALTSILVIFWPLPLYFSGYIFSATAFSIWVWIAVMWVIGSAIVIVIKPLIEGKIGIIQVVKMICLSLVLRIRNHAMQEPSQGASIFREKQSQNYFENSKRILVPVDGSIHSLKALKGAAGLFDNVFQTKIFALNVIEWTDEEEESLDSEMTSRIEEEGRRMLRSVVIPTEKDIFERIVKVGDPSSKIVELAEKLDVDLIMMGRTGIGNSNDDIGHVTRRVLKITFKPVILFK
ncbi:MAG: sodium/solute symporter [Nitrososphaeraceae archaeon]|nr:sodium/solute symporter [Nitrososphaeraceae archaeon]MDW0333101.1 sodium/solute symporter [Nitrososphaeraceae archaeon]